MKTFRFELYQLIPTWNLIKFEAEANSLEEAEAMLKEHIAAGDFDPFVHCLNAEFQPNVDSESTDLLPTGTKILDLYNEKQEKVIELFK